MGSYKSYQSLINNSLGKMLEEMILGGCEYYRRKGIAEINRIPEQYRVIRTNRDGKFSGQFTGFAHPDFLGSLKDGQTIVFEAKATATDRIQANVLSAEQKKKLNTYHLLGAVVGVCCQVKKTYAFIPWEHWCDMKGIYGRLYMTEADVQKFAVKTPGFVAFLDPTGESPYEC